MFSQVDVRPCSSSYCGPTILKGENHVLAKAGIAWTLTGTGVLAEYALTFIPRLPETMFTGVPFASTSITLCTIGGGWADTARDDIKFSTHNMINERAMAVRTSLVYQSDFMTSSLPLGGYTTDRRRAGMPARTGRDTHCAPSWSTNRRQTKCSSAS